MAERILIVEDEEKIARFIELELKHEGYEVGKCANGREGLAEAEQGNYDLMLLDIMLPELNGFEVLRRLRRTSDLPVILLTARDAVMDKVAGLDGGADDYITKPFVPIVMKKRIETQIALAEYERSLEEKVAEKVEEIESMYDLMTISFAGLVESRDGVTGGHLKNTSLFFKLFIEYLMELPQYRDELPESLVRRACRSAPLHDVGKIAIEDAVLRKAGGLSKEEFEQMKMHSVIGGDIFAFIKGRIPDREFAEVAEQIARYHHEKWNGSGYPDGLKGKNIPLVARIMSIVDVYDALTSKRPYKEPFSHERAMIMIAEKSGIEFDPELVNEFLNIEDRIKACLHVKEQMITEQQYFMVHCNKNF